MFSAFFESLSLSNRLLSCREVRIYETSSQNRKFFHVITSFTLDIRTILMGKFLTLSGHNHTGEFEFRRSNFKLKLKRRTFPRSFRRESAFGGAPERSRRLTLRDEKAVVGREEEQSAYIILMSLCCECRSSLCERRRLMCSVRLSDYF